MRELRIGIMVCLAAGACGDAAENVPAPGRYAYEARHPNPGAGDSLTLSGALVLDETTPEEIAGRWDVSRLKPPLEHGRWEEDAYLAYAYPTYGGIAVHRISPGDRPGELRCEGHYTWVAEGGVERDVPLSCRVWQDTIGAPRSVPLPRSPMIYPDVPADTAGRR